MDGFRRMLWVSRQHSADHIRSSAGFATPSLTFLSFPRSRVTAINLAARHDVGTGFSPRSDLATRHDVGTGFSPRSDTYRGLKARSYGA